MVPAARRAVRALAIAALMTAPVAAATSVAQVTLGGLAFTPCTLAASGQAITVAARCATFTVPEDRARPAARKIELAIAWVPSTAKRPARDPVVMLAGGPGQAALESFPLVAGAFREVLRSRDVILVDQRGTGRSHPLECPRTIEAARSTLMLTQDVAVARELAASCLAEIDDADPRFYTTSDYVADLEQVRETLGLTQWNLVGVSYGTRVALEYLRRHPAAVRTVVLDSVVPPTLLLGAEHARNLEDAVDAHFARCERDATCKARFGAPRAGLDALLADLRAQPKRVRYRDPLTDELREDDLTADAVVGVVRLHAYSPQFFALLPLLLENAAGGRHDLLMAQARMIEQMLGEQINVTLQLSVGCAEDAPGLRANPADADTLLGTAFVEFLQAQCEVWPRGRAPVDFHAPVRSDVPVLVLSGEYDPVTPPRYGEEVLRTLTNARHLVLRGQGHSVLGVGCAPRLFGEFVERASPKTPDATCLDALGPTPPFAGSFGWEP